MNIKWVLKKRNLVLFVLLLAVISAAALIIYRFSGSSPKINQNSISINEFNILPADSNSTGVNIKSDFRVSCPPGSNESVIKSLLYVEPEQSYQLKKASSNEYSLSFDKALEPNKIYKFVLSDNQTDKTRSWAFQTQKDYRVLSTLPRDTGTSVPINTGIEINFNYENQNDIKDYFEIEPAAKGHFEYHRKTIVFVPEILEHNTLYTIRIKKGYGIKDSDVKLNEDYTFRFQTEAKAEPAKITDSFSFSDTLYNITSKVTPTLEIYADQELKNSAIEVEVYNYKSSENFISDMKKYDTLPSWAFQESRKITFETGNLNKYLSFKTKMVTGGNSSDWDYPHYIVLPKELPEGYYLIKARIQDEIFYTHLEVNDLSVYISVLKGNSLVWVNDSVTGQPVIGASVETEGPSPALTGKDGVALLDGNLSAPATGSHYYFKVTPENRLPFTAMVNTTPSYSTYDYNNGLYLYNYDNEVQNHYWTYLYHDRGLYLPSDTIKIWGILKPRENEKVIEDAVLQLVPSSYWYTETSNVIDSKAVKLSTNGTFEGQFDFTNLNPGYYSIQLVKDKTILTEGQFEVKQYSKPAYKISINSDKKAMFGWDKADYNIETSFFEGTPVSGVRLGYYINYNTDKEKGLLCDDKGHTKLSLPAYFKDDNSWRPKDMNLTVHNAAAEEQEITANSSMVVYPRDTMVEIDAKKSGDTVNVEVNSNLIDFSNIKNQQDYYDEDKYRGNTKDIPLKAVVYEKHWEAKEIATRYDFINKKSYKEYEYYEVKNIAKELQFTTNSGKYEFNYTYSKNRTYSIEVTGYDSRNLPITESKDFYFDYQDTRFSPRLGYSLKNLNKKDFYKPGDIISLKTVPNSEATVLGQKVRSLYITMKNGYKSYSVVDGQDYSFEFTREHIPNLYVASVIFDGTDIYSGGMNSFVYDSSLSELKLEVRTDKSEYKPGETVKATINVKDKGGNPVAANVNLSVVDEAFFALQDQYVNTLESLYSYNLPSGMLTFYLSHNPLDPNSRNVTAEQGGEGGDSPAVRQKFKDTAYFGSVITDMEGNGSISFSLPDNLTSWRLTYQGITDDMKAGNGKVNISTKLPFFTDVIFNNIFLTGDSPVLTVRSFGTELDKTGSVAYTVELDNKMGDKSSYSINSGSGVYGKIQLPKLALGEYSLTVAASYGKYKDSIRKDFKVVDSLMEASRIKSYTMSKDLKLEGGNGLTNITFYNKNSSLLYNTLSSLMYEWGDRIDQKLARLKSAELMKKYFGSDEALKYYSEDNSFQAGNYQLYDGGIALLSYGSSDPVLSAKLTSAAGDVFDKGALKNYFYNQLANKETSSENAAACYWGLASLGEPVLIDIKNMLAGNTTLKEKLYLTAGLCELGDMDTARLQYKKILNENVKEVSTYKYISSENRDESIELTALISVIAMKIDEKEKLDFYKYVTENSAADILTNLEKLMFVKNTNPEPVRKVSFSYSLNKDKKDITLEKNQVWSLTLTPEKLKALKLLDFSGDIGITVRFTGAASDLIQNSSLVGITRKYNGNNNESFKQSDLIKITLTPEFKENAPDGYYEISDILPSGFRYVDRYNNGNIWYPEEVSGQKVVFGYYYSKNRPLYTDRGKYITYYARAVCPGGFTADNAVIKHYDSEIAGFSGKAKINIVK